MKFITVREAGPHDLPGKPGDPFGPARDIRDQTVSSAAGIILFEDSQLLRTPSNPGGCLYPRRACEQSKA